MPNITLATLAGIPGVNPAAMTQANPNSCGAYAIIAAVGAHGGFPMVANLVYANIGPQAVNNNAVTAVNNTYHQLSAAAYTITGILNNVVGNPANPELLATGNVYNSPAAMAQVTMDLGRPAPQINMQAAGLPAMAGRYPNEQARCTAVVGVANVDTNAGAYGAPGLNGTHVVCVSQGGALHWLACGSNGDFYDPANGTLNNNWNPVNTRDPMGGYNFTGLWMEIT